MEKIEELIDIAKSLNMAGVEEKLVAIRQRAENPRAELVLPLIGEFSSGKTTLLTSLMDGKLLEIKTKPTTATIYAIHFSAPALAAQALDANGNWLICPSRA